MQAIHTGDVILDHDLDEAGDQGHQMLKGLASWADSQVDYAKLRETIGAFPDASTWFGQSS